jgi:hypothetical protein
MITPGELDLLGNILGDKMRRKLEEAMMNEIQAKLENAVNCLISSMNTMKPSELERTEKAAAALEHLTAAIKNITEAQNVTR